MPIKTASINMILVNEDDEQRMMEPAEFIEEYLPSGKHARKMFEEICAELGVEVPE